jgi:hypothetical protein
MLSFIYANCYRVDPIAKDKPDQGRSELEIVAAKVNGVATSELYWDRK